jgi:hypothetical protein
MDKITTSFDRKTTSQKNTLMIMHKQSYKDTILQYEYTKIEPRQKKLFISVLFS